MNWLINFLLLLIPSCAIVSSQLQRINNYGPYKIEYLKFEICKGPKRVDCGVIHIDSIRNMSNLSSTLSLSKDCPIKGAKIIIGTVQNNNKIKKLWNHSINKPCEHFVMGPLLTKTLNLTPNNCSVMKGHYQININMIDTITTFLGPNFFYETYFFKVIAYNNGNNFFCIYNMVKILKP